jgi:endonuclease YncB( thermonuclease family)
MMRQAIAILAVLLLTACGPQLGALEKGETGRVVRAYGGDTLELDSGLRVFLAEIDAPRGEDAYAAQSQGELEALALHRDIVLAYGGTRRWVPRPREGQTDVPDEAAIAHVFVKSEGGRWFWLQHEMISRGAAFVRPRHDNHARSAELVALEARARSAERGLWGRREYRPLTARAAAEQALAANINCLRGVAPYRIVEADIAEAQVFDRRASLRLAGAPTETPFSVVVFGESFAQWDGPALASLSGARIRVRGPLGVYRDQPQLCLDHATQLEVLPQS